jgi:hypothetical protein
VPLPRLFIAVGTRRGLIVLGTLTLTFGAAMLSAIATMADHGATVIDFESARTVTQSQAVLREWGAAGERAMWWQLALDTPFAICSAGKKSRFAPVPVPRSITRPEAFESSWRRTSPRPRASIRLIICPYQPVNARPTVSS